MGLNFKGEIDFYLSQVKPKIIVVTKISYVNCEALGGLDEIIEEEIKCIRQVDEKGREIRIIKESSLRRQKLEVAKRKLSREEDELNRLRKVKGLSFKP